MLSKTIKSRVILNDCPYPAKSLIIPSVSSARKIAIAHKKERGTATTPANAWHVLMTTIANKLKPNTATTLMTHPRIPAWNALTTAIVGTQTRHFATTTHVSNAFAIQIARAILTGEFVTMHNLYWA
jgi:hypothetical protein